MNIAIHEVLRGIKRNVKKIVYTPWGFIDSAVPLSHENDNAFPSGSHANINMVYVEWHEDASILQQRCLSMVEELRTLPLPQPF